MDRLSRLTWLTLGFCLLALPAAAQTATLTLTVGGNTSGTVAVIGAGGGLCMTPASTICTFQIPTGSTIRIVANAPAGQQPGRLSSGTGAAAGCALSTCTVTMTSAGSLTATFTTGDGPTANLTTSLGGDGTGSVGADNSRCQDIDPTQPSACSTVYLQGSSVALTATPAAGNRFSGYSLGTGGAAACGSTANCSFTLGGNATVTSTFHRLLAMGVVPGTVTKLIGETATFTALGGYSNGVTEAIAPGLGTWATNTSAQLGTPRYSFGVARLFSLPLFAVGGMVSGAPSAVLERNDGSGWVAKAPMSTPREGLAVADYGAEVYAIGGNTTGGTPLETVERYLFLSDTWEPVPSLARPRRYLGAVTISGALYAVGGETVIGGTPTVVGDVEAYNRTLNTWTPRQPMPTPRRSLGVATARDNILYAIGGQVADGSTVATVEAYDPATNTWTTKTPMPAPRSGAAVAANGHLLYVVGGTGPDGTVQGSTYQYDTANDTWSTKADMWTPRTGLAAIANPVGAPDPTIPLIWAIGGRSVSGAALDTVERFVDSLSWLSGFPQYATVSQSGVATARAYGSTPIIAAAGSIACTQFPVNSCGLLNVETLPTDLVVDVPSNGSTVSQPFAFGGWAINRSATTGPGVSAVHVYAFPSGGGSAIFLGAAQYGLPRVDIGAIFGSQFTNSGFTIDVNTLAAGSYTLNAYALNALSGRFDTVRTAAVTIVTAVSNGMLAVDTPASGATLTSAFEVGGWAIDTGASTGTGIDAVQFFIVPSGTSSEVFIGTGAYGLARPDVGSIFGSRFANSGYHFTITGLGPGNYTLRVKAHSTVTHAYSVVRDVPIAVNANTLISIDTPQAEAVITAPNFSVSGWAIDRTASSSTGVDTLHVWLYPNPGSGQPPIFAGVATYGAIQRPDVAALFGSQFQNSGYVFNINRAAAGLTAGMTCNVVVWAHSTVTNSFTTYALLRVTLQ